ncbi:hypothetical protein HZS55_04695 [Halosimplex rubrum]|uniref:Roadblock/LC7 domain-containing protein n=1 Tax=Halosimplex rubrum TaxID=869889 RepID=A0A7D5P1E4_9EURY|nr:hypothetical protein [Halosimplex rubrum]QLH76641.1 hypothetical protein HZS55_04695 [Halosimplex rubrum]
MTDGFADADNRLSEDRPLGDIAGSLESTLKADLGETLVGLASYEDGEYDVLYRDEAASSQYSASDIRTILKHIQLEAIGTAVYEESHGEPLHATVRVYDTLVTIAVPVEGTTGLVVVVRNDGSHDPYSAIETVRHAV